MDCLSQFQGKFVSLFGKSVKETTTVGASAALAEGHVRIIHKILEQLLHAFDFRYIHACMYTVPVLYMYSTECNTCIPAASSDEEIKITKYYS